MKYTNQLLTSAIFYFVSCHNSNDKIGEQKNDNSEKVNSNYDDDNTDGNEEIQMQENSFDNSSAIWECHIDDGTYSATVDYNNPETGYSATYALDVEVQDCQVVQINFPNDGYLDEDHISYADIDEDGNANVNGVDEKTYDVHIDN